MLSLIAKTRSEILTIRLEHSARQTACHNATTQVGTSHQTNMLRESVRQSNTLQGNTMQQSNLLRESVRQSNTLQGNTMQQSNLLRESVRQSNTLQGNTMQQSNLLQAGTDHSIASLQVRSTYTSQKTRANPQLETYGYNMTSPICCEREL